MDLSFSQEDVAFREEVRAFLREHLPADLAQRESQGFHLDRADVADWQRRLYAKGWVAPNWPKAFGGTGWTAIQKYIFDVRSEEHTSELQSIMRRSYAVYCLNRKKTEK